MVRANRRPYAPMPTVTSDDQDQAGHDVRVHCSGLPDHGGEVLLVAFGPAHVRPADADQERERQHAEQHPGQVDAEHLDRADRRAPPRTAAAARRARSPPPGRAAGPAPAGPAPGRGPAPRRPGSARRGRPGRGSVGAAGARRLAEHHAGAPVGWRRRSASRGHARQSGRRRDHCQGSQPRVSGLRRAGRRPTRCCGGCGEQVAGLLPAEVPAAPVVRVGRQLARRSGPARSRAARGCEPVAGRARRRRTGSERYVVSIRSVCSYRAMLRSAISRSGFGAARPSRASTPAATTARGSQAARSRTPASEHQHEDHAEPQSRRARPARRSRVRPYVSAYRSIRCSADATITRVSAASAPRTTRISTRSARVVAGRPPGRAGEHHQGQAGDDAAAARSRRGRTRRRSGRRCPARAATPPNRTVSCTATNTANSSDQQAQRDRPLQPAHPALSRGRPARTDPAARRAGRRRRRARTR